jgi:hypothetical protein
MAYEVDYKKKSPDDEGEAKSTKDLQQTLSMVVGWVEDYLDSTRDARKLAEKCRDYYDNKQWTAEEKQTLESRGQADTVNNRIKPKVDFLLGTERQTRTDPKAFPRNYPNDEGSAAAATDALRFIKDINKLDMKKSGVFENMLIEGTGGTKTEVKINYKKEKDIIITRIHWDRMFSDPHARELDFSDALYRGEKIWMDLDDAIARFPEKEAELRQAVQNEPNSTDDTHDDKPKERWVNTERNRVCIVECWYHEGDKENDPQNYKVYHCIFTKNAFLVEPKESPYKNAHGCQEDPYDWMSAYVDRDANRYGIVAQYLGPQDEINKRRSKALHLLSTRQVRVDPAIKSHYQSLDELRKEIAKPDGVIQGAQNEIEILTTSDMAQGQFQLLMEAKQEIDSVGVNAALQGKNDANMSGRAIQAKQQGGYIELGPLFDNLRFWQHAIYTKCWNRVKQYWTKEKWVRVTDDENNVKFVGLNAPMTYGETFKQAQLQGQELPPPPPEMMDQPVVLDGQPAKTKNNVAEIDVDIIIDEIPDIVNIQQEQFAEIAKILPVLVQAKPELAQPLAEAMFESSNLRNKDKLLEKLKGGGEADPMQQQQQQMMQMQQQIQQMMVKLEMREKEADIAKTEAETAEIKAKTINTMSDADKKHFDMHVQANQSINQPTTEGMM